MKSSMILAFVCLIILSACSSTGGEEDATPDAGEPVHPVFEVVCGIAHELHNGVQTGTCIRVRSSSDARTIAVKKATFSWQRHSSANTFTVRVSRIFIDHALAGGVLTAHSDTDPAYGTASIALVNEITIDVRGIVFCAEIEVTGVLRELDSLSVDMSIAPGPHFDGPDHGSLSPDDAAWQNFGGPNIYHRGGTCTPPLRGPSYPDVGDMSYGYFVWSRRDASDHNDRDCAHGGSDDWFAYYSLPEVMGNGYSLGYILSVLQ